MTFGLYGDENAMHRLLVRRLRQDRIDFVTSNDVGNAGLSDEAQLAFAAAAGRAILTFDKEDFQVLHATWMRSGREHSGILIVTSDRTTPSALFDWLIHLQAERTADDMRNAILFIGSTSPGDILR